jgi:dTDP-4-dehydrorhamnose reductase
MTEVVVLGSSGQLGQCLQVSVPASLTVSFIHRLKVDITDRVAVMQCLDTLQPRVVINAAAYTAVDTAESDQATAFGVNETAVVQLAKACAARDIALLQLSTDFVFDGKKTTPWLPFDITAPLGIYGASKLAGEQGMLAIPTLRGSIVRTSWLYSEFGNNFVKTMLRLMAERDALGIVCDQHSAPTDAMGLSQVLWLLAARHLSARSPTVESLAPVDVHHWSDLGEISWYDFAIEIQRQALAVGLLSSSVALKEIATTDYATPACRPAYSVLDCQSLVQLLGRTQTPWQDNVKRVVVALAASR